MSPWGLPAVSAFSAVRLSESEAALLVVLAAISAVFLVESALAASAAARLDVLRALGL